MKIAVAVLGYNNKKYLQRVFNSLQKQSFTKYDTFFIDNASTDDSVNLVLQNYPYVRVLRNNYNKGYAKGYADFLSQAFRDQGYDAIVLLNPDVEVNTDWLKELIQTYRNFPKKIGTIQSKILLFDENMAKTSKINSVGNVVHYTGIGTPGEYGRKDEGQWVSDREITYASGACLLIDKIAYVTCGGFDRDFFMYYEDQDLGWRMRILGFSHIISSRSVLWHSYHFDRKNKKWKYYHLEKNRLSFIYKNYSWQTIILLFPALVFLECIVFLDALCKGYFMQKVRANKYFLKNIFQLHKKRVIIQKQRTLTDADMKVWLTDCIIHADFEGRALGIVNKIFITYYKFIVSKI